MCCDDDEILMRLKSNAECIADLASFAAKLMMGGGREQSTPFASGDGLRLAEAADELMSPMPCIDFCGVTGREIRAFEI